MTKKKVRYTNNTYVDENLNSLLHTGTLSFSNSSIKYIKPKDHNIGYLQGKLREENSEALAKILSLKNEFKSIYDVLTHKKNRKGETTPSRLAKRKYIIRLEEIDKELCTLLDCVGVPIQTKYCYDVIQGIREYKFIDDDYVKLGLILNKKTTENEFIPNIIYQGDVAELFEIGGNGELYDTYNKYLQVLEKRDINLDLWIEKEKIQGYKTFISDYFLSSARESIVHDANTLILNKINEAGYSIKQAADDIGTLYDCLLHNDNEGATKIVNSSPIIIRGYYNCLMHTINIWIRAKKTKDKLYETDAKLCETISKCIERKATFFTTSTISVVKELYNIEFKLYQKLM